MGKALPNDRRLGGMSVSGYAESLLTDNETEEREKEEREDPGFEWSFEMGCVCILLISRLRC